MSLSAGAKLGPYEVLNAVGAGGMGEVYRARDTRLDRVVAVKILPSHLSQNEDARQRFDREARAISSLNHPSICHLYDVGLQDGTSYLVMEYLAGETLADRLRKGPLPLEQVLRVGAEICDGLEKAHRSGVVHRDLKPSNIMLTKTGAKLMDFGLAKTPVMAVGAGSSSDSLATMTRPLTAEGAIVGTFQYMSPEQVEGKEADARSDIFSLGAVLYEMVTGKKAFEGKTPASTIAAILAAEPQAMPSLQPMTPPAVEHLVKKCLAKDPDQRWQNVSDLGGELVWLVQLSSQSAMLAQPAAGPRKRTIWMLTALAAAVIAAGATWWTMRQPIGRSMYFSSLFQLPANDVALSPDGKTVALVAYSEQANRYMLWVNEVGGRKASPVPGTEDASHPFWSPDDRFIGFFSQGKLKKVDVVSGTSAQVLCDAPNGRGGTWNRDGVILFSPDTFDGLYRVSSVGGTSVKVTVPDRSRFEMSHRWPSFLPDGHHFLYLAANFGGDFGLNAITIGSLDSRDSKVLFPASSNAAYVEPGYLLYWKDNALLAQAFDVHAYSLRGEPHIISEEVQYFAQIDLALFGAADNGTLVFQAGNGPDKSQFIWFSRAGKQLGRVGEAGLFADPALSPDGRRVAFHQMGGGGRMDDIWVRELAGDAAMRLTFGPGFSEHPLWSPYGDRLVYMSNLKEGSAIGEKPADGSGAELHLDDTTPAAQSPWDWSRDGRYILLGKSGELLYLSLPQRELKPLLRGNRDIRNAQFSPDGKWIAYSSNESGTREVYVSPFPNADSKWQVSSGGGKEPRWRRDGRELFYLSGTGAVMAAPVKMDSAFKAGAPVTLFQTHPRQGISAGDVVTYDVTPDGQKFLINTVVDESHAAPLSLILNWAAEMDHAGK